MKIICNEGCNKEFDITGFKTETVQKDIQKIYFNCPNCGKEYIAFYSNDKIKALQEQQRELLKRSDPAHRTPLQIKGIMNRVNANKRKIKAEADRLRKEVEIME